MFFFKKKPETLKLFYILNDKANESTTFCPFGIKIGDSKDIDYPVRHIGTNGCYDCKFNKEKDKQHPQWNINFGFKMGYVQCNHPVNEGEKKLIKQIENISLQFVKTPKKGIKKMDEKTLEQVRLQIDEAVFTDKKVEDIANEIFDKVKKENSEDKQKEDYEF